MRAKEFIYERRLKQRVADEDYHPNETPPGPEFKPTMPKGTVKVDVSDVYDWYKLGQHISNLKGLGKHDFGSGPPSTIMAFGDEDTEHKYIGDLEKTGLTTTDIDPVDPHQPKGMKRQKVDPTYNVGEGVAESTNGKTSSGYTWSFEHGGEIPWKSGAEANTFIRVKDGKGKTVLGVWADVYKDTVEVQYSEVFDKKLRGKGIYTDFLKGLSKHYNIISDQDQNNAAREIYKKLGAAYDYKTEKHTLSRPNQGVAEDSVDEAKKRKRKKNHSPRSITTGWWGTYFGDSGDGGDGGGGE
jgi:hypothetical protein